MARPKADADSIRLRLMDEAERMLAESEGRRLVLSEIAARLGMSQSYAYRFFPTKADLVRALALRWFKGIEMESDKIVALNLPAGEKLDLWILTILSLKRDRYDADPQLFNAYLILAAGHMDIVAEHALKLSQALERILADLVPPSGLQDAVALVEDATILFRVPMNISRFRSCATDTRAKAVLAALRHALA